MTRSSDKAILVIFRRALSLAAALIMASCGRDSLESDGSIVVDGWIESGKAPVVILTKTISISSETGFDMNNLEDIVATWAKVTVSDGENSVVLTGRSDKSYYPPYIYTTSKIKGEAGKTYYLKVEYDDIVATSEATIPEPVNLDSLVVIKCQDSDSLYELNARFRNPFDEADFRFFTMIRGKEKRFYPSFMGLLGGVSEGNISVPVLGNELESNGRVDPYFRQGDSVTVKLAHLDEEAYDFWLKYDNLVNTAYMFTSPSSKIPSNIDGGKGHWTGYGISTRNIVIR